MDYKVGDKVLIRKGSYKGTSGIIMLICDSSGEYLIKTSFGSI